jgi:CHASE1-domain containing sensor protein
MPMSRKVYDSATTEIRAAGTTRTRWPRIVAVLLTGVVLSGVLAWVIQRSEAAGIEADFKRDAQDRISAFKLSLVHGVDSLVALEALYASTSDVSRAAFRRFTGDHLLEEPGVRMLGWAPMVSAGDRAEFERSVQAETDDDPFIAAALGRFGLFEAVDESPVAVGLRPEYFPVLFAEPPSLGIHVLGFDIGSEPLQRDAMHRARDSGEMSATGRAALGPGSDRNAWGTIIFRPVFDQLESGSGTGSTDVGSGRALRGFVYGMFEVGEIVERALETLEPRGVDVAVHDLLSPRAESLFYFHSSRLQPDGEPWTLDEALGQDSLFESEEVRVGDRDWLTRRCWP